MSLVDVVSVTFSVNTSSGLKPQPPVQISAAKESQVNTRIGLLKLKQTD